LSNDGSWSVTFWAGVEEDEAGITKSKWHGIRAKQDTGSDENWVRRDIIERAAMSHHIKPLDNHELDYVDFGGNEHSPTEGITLTWFLNSAARTRATLFLIGEAFPCDMIFGKKFLDKETGKVKGTVLPIFGRPRSKGMPYFLS